MNNSFDFKRFGQVLAKDWKQFFRNFGISLMVWCSLPILVWIATLVWGFDMQADDRIPFFFILVFTVAMIVPSKVYGKANLSREGVGFAMLPATNAEKFFSMLLYCSIFTPLIVGLGSWAIDSILTLLPFGGFVGYVALPKDRLVLLVVSITCMVLLTSSIFLFGNMVFKKRKAGKTVAWGILIIFVVTMILQLFDFFEKFTMWEYDLPDHSILPWLNAAVMFVGAIFFYVLTYRKIKTQKY